MFIQGELVDFFDITNTAVYSNQITIRKNFNTSLREKQTFYEGVMIFLADRFVIL